MNLVVQRIDRETFDRSRLSWNGLVQAMPRPSVFCTWEWIDAWWRHFGHLYEPVILFVNRDDVLTGILPLAMRRMVVEDGVVAGRVLTYCGSHDLDADHLDFIGSPRDADDCISAILSYLGRTFRGWDVLHLSHVPEDSELVAWERTHHAEVQSDLRYVSSAMWISLPGNSGEYEKRLPGDKRRDLNRLRRVLYEKSDIHYEKYDATLRSDGVRDLMRLHAARAGKRRTKSRFRGEAVMRFHEDIVREFHALGRLRFRFLRQGDRAIAANYCFEYEGRLFGYQQGMDPAWDKRSVGTVLLFEMIREACDSGMREFDLLRGAGHHKSLWTNQQRSLVNVNVYNTNIVGVVIRLTYRFRNIFVSWVKRVRGARPQHD